MSTPDKETQHNKLKKGDGSYYQRKSDGRWCASVTLPSVNGNRRRKTVLASSQADAERKARELRKTLAKDGDIPTKTQTLESWANVWFNTIAVKKIRPKTAATYRTYLEQYIIPTIGHVQLLKLTPAHVRAVAQFIENKGLSSTTAVQAHRILSVCLKYAEREGRMPRNVADFTDAPRKAKPTLAVLTANDGVKVLQTVANDRLASRWAAALLTGARQGELLGLELDRVTDVLNLSWQLQRLSWEHGCKTPCKKARATDCPDRKLTKPGDWEHRHLTGGLWLARPKSEAGARIIPLVDPLRSIIELRISQAASEPNPHGLLWTAGEKMHNANRATLDIDGSPIDPRIDNESWHEVLVRAGIEHRDANGKIIKTVRLHDARHTTASLLLKAGVREEYIMKILGHSSYAMSRHYEEVDRSQLVDALTKMSALMPLE